MAQGRLDDACPKLAESHRLDPGGGTLLNLAVCHEGQGKTATAWAEFKEGLEAARRDGRADRERFARISIERLEPRLSRLRVVVLSTQAALGVRVERDGVPMDAELLRAEVPVDPGPHVIVAIAPGYRRWQTEVHIGAAGDRVTVEVPPLERWQAAPPREQPSARSDSLRTAGYVVGGLGLVALGVGGGFGINAIVRDRKARERCSAAFCPDEASLSLSREANLSATVANVGMAAGLAAVGASAALFVVSGKHPAARGALASNRSKPWIAPLVGSAGGGILLGGAW
jgi:hypothetical protein